MINASIVGRSIDNFGGSKDRAIKIKGDLKPLGTTWWKRYSPKLRPANNSPKGILHCPVIRLMYILKKKGKRFTIYHNILVKS